MFLSHFQFHFIFPELFLRSDRLCSSWVRAFPNSSLLKERTENQRKQTLSRRGTPNLRKQSLRKIYFSLLFRLVKIISSVEWTNIFLFVSPQKTSFYGNKIVLFKNLIFLFTGWLSFPFFGGSFWKGEFWRIGFLLDLLFPIRRFRRFIGPVHRTSGLPISPNLQTTCDRSFRKK